MNQALRKGRHLVPFHSYLSAVVATTGLLIAVPDSPLRAEAAVQTPAIKTATWMIPIVVESRSDASETEGRSPLLPGFQKTGIPGQYDARELAEAMGADFPESSESLFVQGTGTLIVRNTPQNLERIEFVLSRSGLANAKYHVAVELSVFECKRAAESHPTEPQWPTMVDLNKMPPEDRVLLDRVSGTSQSNEQVVIRRGNSAGQDSPVRTIPASDSVSSGASGIEATYKPIVAFDGNTIESNLDFLWRGFEKNGFAPQIGFSSSRATFDGSSRVLALSRGQTPDTYYVVTGRENIVPPASFDLKKLKAIAKRYPTKVSQAAR